MAQTLPTRQLIDKYLDRAATADEVAELTRRLREDPTAADAFARACRLDSQLSQRFREQKDGGHLKPVLHEVERNTRRRRSLRRSAIWAAAGAALIAAGWMLLHPSYPVPRASGVTVTDGSVRRGATVRTADAQHTKLVLGGYCTVRVEPNSIVRVGGEPRNERIVLERGRVTCDVTAGNGQFAVETEHCTISVKGTRFSVELLENQGGHAMLSKHALVKVFAGAVLVAAAGAQEVVEQGEEKLVPGKVTVTAESLAMRVGQRRTYALISPDGNTFAHVDTAVIGKQVVGKDTLYRVGQRIGGRRRNDFWLAVGDDGFAYFHTFGVTLPGTKHPLPLEEGMAFEYESTEGKVSARVVGTEAVEVPAGKYACLKIQSVHKQGEEEWTRTSWVAPGIGTVKDTRPNVTIALARFQPTGEAKPQEGAVTFSSFDTEEPLRSPILGRARWEAHMGEPGRSSDVDIDPFTGGADGTPFCLRWTYTTLGTWVSASIGPGAGKPADLSKYAGISFYVKGLLGKQGTLTIVGRSPEGGNRPGMAHIRFQVTQKWQKIIVTPDTHPELKNVDLTQVYSIGLSDYAREGAAHNVIWLDEVKFHEDAQLLIKELQDREKILQLLDAPKGDF